MQVGDAAGKELTMRKYDSGEYFNSKVAGTAPHLRRSCLALICGFCATPVRSIGPFQALVANDEKAACAYLLHGNCVLATLPHTKFQHFVNTKAAPVRRLPLLL